MVGLSAISHPNVIQALAAYTIVQFTIFWAMLALIIREIGIGTASLKHLKEYLRFGLPVLPQSLATWLIVGSDRFLIGMFIGLTYVGYYAPAYGVGSTVMMFMAPLGTLLPSALSELHDIGREAEMWKRIKQSLIAYLILAIPAGIVVSIFARNILIIFSTAEIAANSYQIVPVMVMATIIYSGQAILSNVLIVKKKMIVLTWITIITAIVSVGANLILIPRYGLLGAATALYIAYMVQMVLTAHQSFKTYRDWKDNHTMPLCNGR
jgi:O-antigen/teichoic acid export membrane protein